MKKLTLIILCITVTSVYSQNTRPKDIKDAPQIKERIANNGQKPVADIKVSNYHGFDSQISAMMMENKIPSDCPTAMNYPDRKKYLAVLNKWLQENQDKVANEKKNLIITE